MTTIRIFSSILVAALWWSGTALTAIPPRLMNYQGVLRDSMDNPQDGNFDMEFRFYDSDGGGSCVGGTLLLTDSHLAAGTGDVTVSGGLFNVQLGGGDVTLGAGTHLSNVFRDHAAVFVEIHVDGEQLCPRVRVTSAAYAFNADHLDGLTSSAFAGAGHNHAGESITTGTVADARIASTIARDNEILPTVLANDGAGSTLDADLIDGMDASSFVTSETDPQVGALNWGRLPRWTGAALEDGTIYDNGTRIGIGTTVPDEQLHITGNFELPATTTTTGAILSDGNLFIHQFGSNNFYAGKNAGNLTMTGSANTAVGSFAFGDNIGGGSNVAIGVSALATNTNGSFNVALGVGALGDNTTGSNNTAVGSLALSMNTTCL